MLTGQLQPINSRQRQHTLKYCSQADQNHQKFEKDSQARFVDKSVDGPEANRADDADNQDPDYD
jgi:hypothetical protein